MQQSGIIFQPVNRQTMPDPDTLVLGMAADGEAHIGQLWYDEHNEVFICSSENGMLIVVKWAHITPVEMPDPVAATAAAQDRFNGQLYSESRLADFFAGWHAAINHIKSQLA